MPGFWTEDGTALALELLIKAGVSVHLFTAPVAPGPTTPLEAFIEPNDSGYQVPTLREAQVKITAGAPSRVSCDPLHFSFAVNLVPSTVRGYFLKCDSRVVGVEVFKVAGEATPVEVTTPGSRLTVTPMLTLLLKKAS